MAADIRGVLYGLWFNFRGVVSLIEPICEFIAETRDFDRIADRRTFDRMALTREYDFEAEDSCG